MALPLVVSFRELLTVSCPAEPPVALTSESRDPDASVMTDAFAPMAAALIAVEGAERVAAAVHRNRLRRARTYLNCDTTGDRVRGIRDDAGVVRGSLCEVLDKD